MSSQLDGDGREGGAGEEGGREGGAGEEGGREGELMGGET